MAGWSGIYFQLVLQVSFLIAAVASTLLAQALSYQGAAHEHSMLIVLFEYLGMSSVWIFRAMLPGGSGEHDEVDHEHHAVPTHEDGGGGGAHSNSSSSPSSPGLGPASAAPPSPSESPFKVAATSQLRYDDADESNSSSSSSSSTASSALPAHRPDTGSSASASSQSGLADIGTNAGVALASASAHGIVTVASTAKDLIWLTSAWLGTRIAAALNLAPPRSTTTSSASSAAASSASSADAASTSSSSSASSDSAIVRLQVMRALGQDDMSSGSSSSSSSSSFSGASGSSLHWLTGCSRDCISGVVMLTVLDLAAAAFGFFGLVYAGSGAFAVVNSASLAVTAVLSRVLLKRPLSRPKTMAVCAVTGGLALAGLGALLAPAELSTAPLLLTAKGVTRLEEHSFFTGTTRIVFGILFTLFSTILYSLEYVLAEQILVAAQKDKSITSAQLCGYMGFTGSSIFLLYVLFYTIPNWNHLVTQEMIRHRAKAPTVVLLYFIFLIAEAAYNMLYFMLLETAGALVAGVLQGLRAVCVFAFSSVFFCKNQHSQCFNGFKGFSTMIVIGGVGVYAFLSYIEDKRAAIEALTAPADSPAGLEADSVGSNGQVRSTAIEFADSAPSAAAGVNASGSANHSVAASARPALYQLGRAAQQEHMQLQPPQPQPQPQRVLSALPPPAGADSTVAGRPSFTPLPPPPAALVSSALASSLASSISQKSPSWTASTPSNAMGTASDAGSVPPLVEAAASHTNQDGNGNGNQSQDASALGAVLAQTVTDAPLSLSS